MFENKVRPAFHKFYARDGFMQPCDIRNPTNHQKVQYACGALGAARLERKLDEHGNMSFECFEEIATHDNETLKQQIFNLEITLQVQHLLVVL